MCHRQEMSGLRNDLKTGLNELGRLLTRKLGWSGVGLIPCQDQDRAVTLDTTLPGVVGIGCPIGIRLNLGITSKSHRTLTDQPALDVAIDG